MYLKAFEEETIPDTETVSLNYSPRIAYWPLVETTSSNPIQMPHVAHQSNSSPDMVTNTDLTDWVEIEVAHQSYLSPDMVTNTNLPDWVEQNVAHESNTSPAMVTNTDLPEWVEPEVAHQSYSSPAMATMGGGQVNKSIKKLFFIVGYKL